MKKARHILLMWFIFLSFATYGQMNIAVVGQGYKPNGQPTFLSDIEHPKKELFVRLWQWKHLFNFEPLSWKNEFGCEGSNFLDGGTCNDTRVIKEVNSFNITYHKIIVLAPKLKSGGGGTICLIGTYFHDSFRSGNMGLHEIAHSWYGLQHNSFFMNASCNNGSCAQLYTFNTSEFNLINQVMSQYGSAEPATINIVTPRNNYTTTAGGSLRFEAELTGGVESVEVIYDGISKGVFMCWERGNECKPNSIVFWLEPLSAGQHTMTMTATDVNDNSVSSSVNITVN